MTNAHKYANYVDFALDFIPLARENGTAFAIVRVERAIDICQTLNGFTIGANSIAIKNEFLEETLADIESAKEDNSSIIITLFDNGELICEKAMSDSSAYVDNVVYLVECGVDGISLPHHSKISLIQFNND